MNNYKIVLVGNPNSGKTTLFNILTGSNQKVGNFAGVTVDKISGYFSLNNDINCEILDLPGTYSIYPSTEDETISTELLLNFESEQINLVLVVCDATNLYRNLLLFSQLYDLKLPIILVLNMMDELQNLGSEIDIEKLKDTLKIPIIGISAKRNKEIESLKNLIHIYFKNQDLYELNYQFYKPNQLFLDTFLEDNHTKSYKSIVQIHKKNISNPQFVKENTFETISRYKSILNITNLAVKKQNIISKKSVKIDKILLNPYLGNLCMLLIFLGIFQAIFSWSEIPMNLIDTIMNQISNYLKLFLGNTLFSDFITDGLLSGITGIVIFIPQIAFLFFFISLLEESGYMARVMFLLDTIMRKFGLNGKSIISLFTGAACAIPAIMAARNISNKKEKYITIFITPFMSCSARIPVYTIIISTVIPSVYYFNIINLQALVMISLYCLGILIALITALILSKFMKTNDKSNFIIELPEYRIPQFKNVFITIKNKTYQFITESGKIILIISMMLWFLSNFSPQNFYFSNIDNNNEKNEIVKLENSFAGIIGKKIEPFFEPLGFDWRIDIAIITSFAAREVFVSTISTIYSIENQDDTKLMKEKLLSVKDTKGNVFFNLARGASILVFYALALQCMSTIAISKRETGSWKVPILQFSYSLFLAYFLSYIVYLYLSC